MNINNILKDIKDSNDQLYGECCFKININTNPDQFEDYVNSLPNEDFVIEIGGNINDFYGTKSLLDN